jgi:hypothetical protein
MSSSKGVLTKELGDLLGFDDGAEDVLEHLLSIESSEVSLVCSKLIMCCTDDSHIYTLLYFRICWTIYRSC